MASSLMFLFSLATISKFMAVIVHGQKEFLNIDCGRGYSYIDHVTGLKYISDYAYIDSGVVHTVSLTYRKNQEYSHATHLRSFPSGKRNCYTLKPVRKGGSYLVRAYFLYGNYDGLNRLPKFELHLDVNLWETIKIDNASTYTSSEILAVAPAKTMSLCLVNIGHGTPFVSAIEVRPLLNTMYEYANASQSLVTFRRLNIGGDASKREIRYKNDRYDRLWRTYNQDDWKTQNTTSFVKPNSYKQPQEVMATQSIPKNGRKLEFKLNLDIASKYHVMEHYAELQLLSGNQTRSFTVDLNDQNVYLNSKYLKYLEAITSSTTNPISSDVLHWSLLKADDSTLPPIINAIEVYIIRKHEVQATHDGDVEAMVDIKTHYVVKKNWMGDPCAPKRFTWQGLKCSDEYSKNPRIISLTLSSSGLIGRISSSFGKLNKLHYLDLSNNSLTGVIPEFLGQLPHLRILNLQNNNLRGPIPKSISIKVEAKILVLKVEGNPLMNNPSPNLDDGGTNLPLILGATIGGVVALFVVGLVICWIYKKRRRVDQLVPTQTQEEATPANEGQATAISFKLNKNYYTYYDLQTITNGFMHLIGEGGFGNVYKGRLKDGTLVAVKKISKISPQALKQFKREVKVLARICHNNLVSLIGYCYEDDCIGLVYEHMAWGSLADNLRGERSKLSTLSWRERVHILLEVAQGFHHLHNANIIHGDVKTSNILLGENMEVKIGDFGMSRIFESDTFTQVITIAGTPGYIDPEYLRTGILNKGNDIYSFGIVLLELITGQPAINNSTERNLLDWVKSKLETTKLEDIVDDKLQEYNPNSVKKVMDIALSCTASTNEGRPTMIEVLSMIKDCVGLKNVQGEMSQVSSQSTFDITQEMFTMETSQFFNPNAR